MELHWMELHFGDETARWVFLAFYLSPIWLGLICLVSLWFSGRRAERWRKP